MSALPAAPPPPVDLVTALQEQLARINAMLFNYLGALQRDAPAQSVKGEALVSAPKTYDVQVCSACSAWLVVSQTCLFSQHSSTQLSLPAASIMQRDCAFWPQHSLCTHCPPSFAAPRLWLQAQTELMASDLMAGLKDAERLIQQLPETSDGEAEEVAQAVVLLQQNAEASQELRRELAAASAKLGLLQDAHGVLAEAALCQGPAAAAAAGGPAGRAAAGQQPGS